MEKELQSRSDSKCELCSATYDLKVYTVPPKPDGNVDHSILVCDTCYSQIEDPEKVDANHWRCLNDSMWSEVPAVKAKKNPGISILASNENPGYNSSNNYSKY